jgi:uncharacterized protein YndB with AHSA1/START domain
MSSITYSMEINAPIEQVFACVDDDEQVKRWMEGVEEITYLDPPDRDNPVGTRFKQRIREGGRVAEYEGKVIAYDKPRHLGISLGNKQFTMQVDYRFAPIDGGTRLDYSAEMIAGNGFVRVMGVLFGWMTRRILRNQMAALKTMAESAH